MSQWVVLRVPLAARHPVDLGTDGDHGVTEPIDLPEWLGFGRLDHERAGHRERHGGSMEPVVDEALGHVVDGDPGVPGDATQVEDALVGDEAVPAGVEDGVVVPQACRHIVGCQQGVGGGGAESLGTHHGDVHPRDGQDACRTPRCARDGARAGGRSGRGDEGGGGQERREVGPHTDRTDARSATAVGDAEGLVEVEVADVCSEVPRFGDSDERIEVGPVKVHLTAVVMDEGADLCHPLLEHAVRGRVGDHEAGQLVAVLGNAGPEVVDVDVAVLVTGDHHDTHARHRGRCCVGAVGG